MAPSAPTGSVITSAARGAHYLFPESECVLDIGGQSTRAVGLRDAGKVKAFKTNDKCAAGSGMFLARAAKYLGIEVEQIGELSMSAQNPQPISSICAVLAESEIINHVSAGASVEIILRGILGGHGITAWGATSNEAEQRSRRLVAQQLGMVITQAELVGGLRFYVPVGWQPHIGRQPH